MQEGEFDLGPVRENIPKWIKYNIQVSQAIMSEESVPKSLTPIKNEF